MVHVLQTAQHLQQQGKEIGHQDEMEWKWVTVLSANIDKPRCVPNARHQM